MPLTDWQMSIGSVLVGEGSPFSIVQVSGLLDLPDLRVEDRARLRRHGLRPGESFAGGRSVEVVLEAAATTDAALREALVALSSATAPGAPEFQVTLRLPGVADGQEVAFWARARRRSIPINLEFFYRLPLVTLELFATDPRLYSATEQTKNTSVQQVGAGMSFPETFPLVFGSLGSSGTITCRNDGNFDSPPVFTITGSATQPRIENLTTGKTMEFTGTVGSAETLTVDVDERSILLNGTPAFPLLASGSEWIDLIPGPNIIRFRTFAGLTADLSVTWRSAWL